MNAESLSDLFHGITAGTIGSSMPSLGMTEPATLLFSGLATGRRCALGISLRRASGERDFFSQSTNGSLPKGSCHSQSLAKVCLIGRPDPNRFEELAKWVPREDVAKVAVFLASDDAHGIMGQTIDVPGRLF
ncbi:MAG: hypothetical protein AB1648_16825 [Pseudomonadota bacterium]